MKNPELHLQVMLLLERAPTRSAEVRHLHHQIRERLGPRSPTLSELYAELRSNRTFLLLERDAGLDPGLDPGYGAALEAAGLRPAPRVMLAADDAPPAPADPLVLAAGSLRVLLERSPGLEAAVGAALEQVDRLAAACAPPVATLTGAGTGPSTIPLPGSPPRAPARRRWRSPASRPPPPAGSRSG